MEGLPLVFQQYLCAAIINEASLESDRDAQAEKNPLC
jgi:hypothetical protein